MMQRKQTRELEKQRQALLDAEDEERRKAAEKVR